MKKSWQEILESRCNKSLDLDSSRYSYKSGAGGEILALDAIGPVDQGDNEPDVDLKRMSAWVKYVDGNGRDSVGDLIRLEGISYKRYLLNPISLWDHGKSVTLPIGRTDDPITGIYQTRIDLVNRTASDCIFFYQGKGMPGVDRKVEYDHATFCQQIFDLWCKKFIRAGSIGYRVLRATPLPPDLENATPQGLDLLLTEKLESSVVCLPANARTVGAKSFAGPSAREILSLPRVAGKPLSPYLVKSLQPYCEPRRAQLGYEGKAMRGNLLGVKAAPLLAYEKRLQRLGKLRRWSPPLP